MFVWIYDCMDVCTYGTYIHARTYMHGTVCSYVVRAVHTKRAACITCACICIYAYVYMCTCMCAYHVCVHVCLCVCTCICNVHAHMPMRVHMHMCVCTYVYMVQGRVGMLVRGPQQILLSQFIDCHYSSRSTSEHRLFEALFISWFRLIEGILFCCFSFSGIQMSWIQLFIDDFSEWASSIQLAFTFSGLVY